jgi:small subunit ribosomal protein S21
MKLVNAEIILEPGQDAEHACRQLKKMLMKNGTMREMKRRSYYEKPSVKLKRKKAEAAKKRRKRERNWNAEVRDLDRRGAREPTERTAFIPRRPEQYAGGAAPGRGTLAGAAGAHPARMA